MELIDVANKIEEKIMLLESGRKLLQPRAESRANTIGAYEKKLGIVIMQLKNGIKFNLDGVDIENPQTTIVEKVARSICFQEKIDMELAEAEYKNAVKGLDCIMAELNGHQSINRHLDRR